MKTDLSIFIIVFLSFAVAAWSIIPIAVYVEKTELLEASLPVHNIDSGENFSSIQEAIDDNETRDGHTIVVDAGTYRIPPGITRGTGVFSVNKQLTLLANGKVVIDSVEAKGFTIGANQVTIQGFTIANLSCVCTAIRVWGYEHVNIINNTIIGGSWIEYFANWPPLEIAIGIDLMNAHHSNITGNTIMTTGQAIKLHESDNCTITGNRIVSNEHYGINLYDSDGCTLTGNDVTSNKKAGIRIDGSLHSILIDNIIASNGIGIHLANSLSNIIFHNHFESNRQQVLIEGGADNSWDDGYPSGGNFWSDYKDRYPNAIELEGSGNWDTSYVIGEGDQDNYPRIKPFVILETSEDENPTTWNIAAALIVAVVGLPVLVYLAKMNLILLVKSIMVGTIFFSIYFLIVILATPDFPPEVFVSSALMLNGIYIFGCSISLSIQTWLLGYTQTIPLKLSFLNKGRLVSRILILIGAIISVFFSFFALTGAGYCRTLVSIIFDFASMISPILPYILFQYSALLSATGLGIMLLSNIYMFIRLRKKLKISQNGKQKGKVT